MAVPVPDLHDDVVALRPPALEDVPAITAAVQDPEIPRFTMVPSPYAERDAIEYVASSRTGWEDASHLSFLVVDHATGGLLGGLGLHHLDPEHGFAYVGYWVAVEARGRGVATRALRLAAGWALGDLGLRRLEALVFVDNERSCRVAAGAGFRTDGTTTVEHPTGPREAFVFARTAPVGGADATR